MDKQTKRFFLTINKVLFIQVLCFCLLFVGSSTVQALTGQIISPYKNAQVCQDLGCTSGAATNINFLPSIVSGIAAINIDDTSGITGNAWGQTLGWINMHPSGGGSNGVMVDVNTGSTTGYAYSPVCGYINFTPTGYGVKIVTETNSVNGSGGVGKFEGYAWCGGTSGGWIKFDCSVGGNAACVKTNWVIASSRTVVTPPTTGGGGGGGGGVVTGNNTPTQNTAESNLQTQTGPQNQKVDYTNEYRSDINDSGVIDLLDYNSLMVNWAKTTLVNMSQSLSLIHI